MEKIKSLSEIYLLIKSFPVPNTEIINEARNYQDQLTKPKGSLGILEDIAIFFCGWQETIKPSLNKIQTIIFAGNHGVCNQGVNSFPQSVTKEMVLNFKNGGAAINQLCASPFIKLEVIPIDLDKPTNDICEGPAMNQEDLLYSINKGIESVNETSDLIILGEMGIGNSTIASAISSASFGGAINKWVGRGTAKFGAVLAARAMKIPVLIDGFICTSSIIPLFLIEKHSLDHCIFGHCSMERGHKNLLKAINKIALLNLNMHLGEGSGAMVALNVLVSAINCHNGMASFRSAGVSNPI